MLNIKAITVIIIFLLVGLSTGSTKRIAYSNCTHTEITEQAYHTVNPPQELAIGHYQNDANTSIIHINRDNYTSDVNLFSEQRLLLRVLQGNGNVIEKIFNNTEEIHINFRYVNDKNPINICPLFDQYTLASYFHANDTTDSITYMDRRMVINRNENMTRPSYLFSNSTIWGQNKLIVNNIAPRNSFLRLSRVRGTNYCKWRQHEYMIAPQIPTNVTTRTTPALVPLTTSITVLHVRPTTRTSQRLYHLKILFLSSGSVLAADRVRPNENSVNIKTLSLGGYTSILRQSFRSIMDFNFSFFDENNQLFDYNFPLNTIIPNQFGAFKILQNSTLLMAQNESSTVWNLVQKILSFNDHGQEDSNNLTINNTEIDIIFYDPVYLEDVKLPIYQILSQGDTLGQVFNSTNCNPQCIEREPCLALSIYKFQHNPTTSEFFESNKIMIILFFIAVLLFTIERLGSRSEREYSVILRLSIILFRFGTFSTFIFTNSKVISHLFVPSIIFFVVPIVFNLSLAFITIFMELTYEFAEWFSIYGNVASLVALLSGADIDIILILKSRLMGLECFNAPFSDRVLNIIFWGSCINLILTYIPGFIIQVCLN
ncbi:hypothetical protein F8M41_013573 [Gigaspora margarita]|uniref:Uncharacterized protein n=1 Tax=Gigaspora margarita TaxID=4874 RepID=A0A8H4ASF0_GIGMA|nr:hypothetical protein F8M41_013573 [Gigaspora margarita]